MQRNAVVGVVVVAIGVGLWACHSSGNNENGQGCTDDESCKSGHCVSSTCNAFGADGTSCKKEFDCKSEQCDLGNANPLCIGSHCSCGTDQCKLATSADCQPGWVCNYVAPSTGILGSSGGYNQCEPKCGLFDAGMLAYQCVN
jgi:hypothetical protein